MKKTLIILSLSIGLPFMGACQSAGLPEKFKDADSNADGKISIPEVREMIDGFFIGKHDHGVMYIHELIDYFFEQA